MTIHLLQILVFCATAAGLIYYVFCLVAAACFFLQSSVSPKGLLPPVTVMIPLRGADPEAYENYTSYCRQEYPHFQIVFGVRDSNDPAVQAVHRLTADFPQTDIALVISDRTIGENLKVSNLENMLAEVKHDTIVIVDSDIRVRTDYLRAIIPPLTEEGVGLVTCPYRSANAKNWPSRLEALWMTTQFMPSVFVARLLEGARYALGATMATTRQRLTDIGGFKALADHLADDYILGYLIWKHGEEVRLVNYVVETLQPPVSFVGMMKHQVRLSRGIRACRPLGHLGLILTFGTTLSLLNVIVAQASALSLGLFGLVCGIRLTCAWLIGVHWLGDTILRQHFWLLPISDLFAALVWGLSYAGKTIEWRGELFRLSGSGKIVNRRRRE
jgi:ceramide glucosyltransferase